MDSDAIYREYQRIKQKRIDFENSNGGLYHLMFLHNQMRICGLISLSKEELDVCLKWANLCELEEYWLIELTCYDDDYTVY